MSTDPTVGLGTALAHAQDEQLAQGRAQRLSAARAALLADARVTEESRSSAWIARTIAVAMIVLVLVGTGVWLRQRAAEVTFTVGDDARARVEAQWIAAPDAPVEVAFSDGSRLVLATGSRARVDTVERSAGRIVLESGVAKITTDAGEARPLVVDAGPFALALADTACDVTWDGATQRLGLVVHEGRVHVSGPADQSHDVAAGQRIEISPHQLIAAADPTAPAVGDTREVADTSVRPGSPSDRAGPERTKPRKNATEKSVVLTDWSALARASKHKEALAAAEAVGFTTLCDSLDAASLLQLADTARFAGRAARSITALEALRRRHPRSDEAVVAAYTLGRIAAAADRHADAAEHFATYLRERPRGSLAREALGRKLEAEAAAGQGARADATAKSYLDRYPAGPHADLAAARLK